jgi:hypothetical protein
VRTSWTLVTASGSIYDQLVEASLAQDSAQHTEQPTHFEFSAILITSRPILPTIAHSGEPAKPFLLASYAQRGCLSTRHNLSLLFLDCSCITFDASHSFCDVQSVSDTRHRAATRRLREATFSRPSKRTPRAWIASPTSGAEANTDRTRTFRDGVARTSCQRRTGWDTLAHGRDMLRRAHATMKRYFGGTFSWTRAVAHTHPELTLVR